MGVLLLAFLHSLASNSMAKIPVRSKNNGIPGTKSIVRNTKSNMMAHACHASMQETEAGGSPLAHISPGVHNIILLFKKRKEILPIYLMKTNSHV